MAPPFLSDAIARRGLVMSDANPRIHTRSSSHGAISRETWIVGAVFAGIVGIIVFSLVARYIQVKYLYKGVAYKPALREDDSPTTRQINRATQDGLEEALAETQARNGQTLSATTANNNTPGVDRNTSVRSVMTLPAYRPKPTETEQVLGREGERDGIDVVVEMPTAEQEEAMRESEMDALYQIRAARRRQMEEAEERRRLRRQLQEAQDFVALRELRDRRREHQATGRLEIDLLRAQHEVVKETRQKAVSSVAYADVGVARADGTRIRANSTDSERVGLLSDAASIAASTNTLLHRREGSAGTLSIDTSRHDRPDSPGLTTGGSAYSLASAGLTPRSRANSGATTPRISSATTRAGSSPELIEAADADLGDLTMPPPDYDEVSLGEITPGHSRRNSNVSAVSGSNTPYNEPPPDYPGPARTRSNRLSAQMHDLASQSQSGSDQQQDQPRSGPPRLPSLRLQQVPQIVIEPSSAVP